VRDAVFGAGNGVTDYLLLLLFYGAMVVLMRYGHARVPARFRRTYVALFIGWGFGTFVANYLLYRAGVMSFLPWLNNALHTFVWIGLCLGFLYAGAHRRPVLEQFALFAIYSFLVKHAEHALLGTWEHPSFFGMGGNEAYIIGWSLMDGLYPVISMVGLKLLSNVVSGLVVPGAAPERSRA
jgi:hypothetical protein